jgi:branched-chain amino acid transport system substrate-binding protein
MRALCPDATNTRSPALRNVFVILGAMIALWSGMALPEETVRIAYIVPLTGPFASVGETQVHHAQFYVDRINARGGVLGGRKLELIPMDNKNSPQEALLQLAQVADRGLSFVVDCCASHVTVALSEAIERHNARNPDRPILLLVEAGDQDVTNDKCTFSTFSFYANAEMMLQALTQVAAAQPAAKRAYLINQDYVWGHSNRKFAREMLTRKRPDIAIVGDDLVPLGKVKDFAPYVAKIKAAGADMVFSGNWGPDLVLLIKAAADARLDVTFYTTSGILWGGTTALGESAIDKVKSQYRWHPNLPFEKERKAREEYRARFPKQEYYAMPSENLLELLAAAIDKAGAAEPMRVAFALEGLRIEGPMGTVVMRADNHQIVEPLYVMTLTKVNGKDVILDMEGTGIGTRTDARVEAGNLMLPTTCKMKRPAKP